MIADREQYFANRLALVWTSQVVEGLLQPACVCVLNCQIWKQVIGPDNSEITFRSGWYLMTYKSFFHTRVKGACYLQNKHLSTLTATSGVLADRSENMSEVLLRHWNIEGFTQECVYTLTKGDTWFDMSFTIRSTILSWRALYIPSSARQPFKICGNVSVICSVVWCKQWGTWAVGNQIERLSLVGRTCSLAFTVKITMSSLSAVFFRNEWSAEERHASFPWSFSPVQCCLCWYWCRSKRVRRAPADVHHRMWLLLWHRSGGLRWYPPRLSHSQSYYTHTHTHTHTRTHAHTHTHAVFQDFITQLHISHSFNPRTVFGNINLHLGSGPLVTLLIPQTDQRLVIYSVQLFLVLQDNTKVVYALYNS